MNIEQIKSALKDAQAQIKAARDEALKLAQASTLDTEAMAAAQSKLEDLAPPATARKMSS